MRWVPLKRLCEGRPQYGLNIPSSEYQDQGIRLLRTTDIGDDGTVRIDDAVYVEPGKVGPEHRLMDGDLLFSRSGTVGRSLRYRDDHGEATFAGYLVRFRPSSDTDPDYLAYCAQAGFFRAAIEADAITSTISNFNAERYATLLVPALSYSRQRAIVDFLDAETARIDAIIAKKRRMRELLGERFLATIDELTKELEAVPLRRVASVTYGLGQPPPASESGVPVLRATNISRGIVTSEDLIRSRLEDLPLDRAPLLKSGEILVVRSGAYTGDSALITDEWVGAAPGYDLRVTPTGIDSRFLAFQMLGRRFLDQVDLAKSRAAQPHLNAEELGRIHVMAASAAVESAIGETLHALDQRRRTLEDLHRRQIDLLEEHRQALITACVTGEMEIVEAAAEAAS